MQALDEMEAVGQEPFKVRLSSIHTLWAAGNCKQATGREWMSVSVCMLAGCIRGKPRERDRLPSTVYRPRSEARKERAGKKEGDDFGGDTLLPISQALMESDQGGRKKEGGEL